jgi:hypothetical protein
MHKVCAFFLRSATEKNAAVTAIGDKKTTFSAMLNIADG